MIKKLFRTCLLFVSILTLSLFLFFCSKNQGLQDETRNNYKPKPDINDFAVKERLERQEDLGKRNKELQTKQSEVASNIIGNIIKPDKPLETAKPQPKQVDSSTINKSDDIFNSTIPVKDKNNHQNKDSNSNSIATPKVDTKPKTIAKESKPVEKKKTAPTEKAKPVEKKKTAPTEKAKPVEKKKTTTTEKAKPVEKKKTAPTEKAKPVEKKKTAPTEKAKPVEKKKTTPKELDFTKGIPDELFLDNIRPMEAMNPLQSNMLALLLDGNTDSRYIENFLVTAFKNIGPKEMNTYEYSVDYSKRNNLMRVEVIGIPLEDDLFDDSKGYTFKDTKNINTSSREVEKLAVANIRKIDATYLDHNVFSIEKIKSSQISQNRFQCKVVSDYSFNSSKINKYILHPSGKIVVEKEEGHNYSCEYWIFQDPNTQDLYLYSTIKQEIPLH